MTWPLLDPTGLLSEGRLSQLDLDRTSSRVPTPVPPEELIVRRSTDWERPPHEAYFLPFTNARASTSVDRSGYALYCDVLHLLTALDGGETILGRFAEHGYGTVPFEDRWNWRSRLHLPTPAWKLIEKALRWSDNPESHPTVGPSLCEALASCWANILTLDDFLRERVDILVDPSWSTEIVRTVRPPSSIADDLPPELQLEATELKDSLLLRIGQMSGTQSPTAIFHDFPRMSPKASNQVLEQIASAFKAPNHTGSHDGPDLIVFPELCIPQPEVHTVRDLVVRTGIASLGGLYWRQLRPAYTARGPTRAARRWFVNEAEFVLPIGHKEPGPTGFRSYRVCKPLPTHIEKGLAKALAHGSPKQAKRERPPDVRWRVLGGRRWYRFLHPRWGDFSIAICSDLLDTAPWKSLHGELVHLFMVAFNQDVNLFDALSWVRAYENYVNVVTVNHGHFGGSVLWTPRRGYSRELAHLRGGDLSVVADVELPVRDLVHAQQHGVSAAEAAEMGRWLYAGTEQRSKFKSPPPGYRRRSLRPKSA